MSKRLLLLLLVLPGQLHSEELAFIPGVDDDSLTVIDTTSNSVLKTFTVGTGPYFVTASPSGKLVLVSSPAVGELAIFDGRTATHLGTIPLDISPVGAAFSRDERIAFVADTSLSASVSAIDLASQSVTHTAPIDILPTAMQRSPDGRELYVVHSSTRGITVLEAPSLTPLRSAPLGNSLISIDVDPETGILFIVDQSMDTLFVVDPVSLAILHEIDTPRIPQAVVVSRTQRRLYLSLAFDGLIRVFDLETLEIIADIPVGGDPIGIDLSYDESFLLVCNFGFNTVTRVDTTSLTATAVIPVGQGPICNGRFIASPQPVVEIPTLSPHLMVLLCLVLGALALRAIRREK